MQAFGGVFVAGSDVKVRALFTDSTNKDGEAGLTVTVSGWGPTATLTVGAVSEPDATNLPGVYEATVAGANTATAGLYSVQFKTASAAVIEKHITIQFVVVPELAVINTLETEFDAFPKALGDTRHYYPIGAITTATISNSVTTLTRPARANGILIFARSQPIAYTIDGTAPVGGAAGFVLSTSATQPTFVPVARSTQMKFIRDGGTNGTLVYQWIRHNP